MAEAIITVGAETSQLERDIQKAFSKDFKLTGLDAKSFSPALGRIKGQLGEFEKSLEASNARVVAFGASAGAIYLLTDAFKSMVQSTINVEKTLADINTVINASEKDIKSFGNTIFDIANKTSQSFETAAEAALEFSRQGLGLEQTAKRTAAALMLARLSGLSAASSVEALTAAVNSFSDAGLDATQVVNKLAAVDAKYAVSSADLAEAIKRVGSSASEAGVSIDELVALLYSTVYKLQNLQ
jgi:phage-related minor tail protein